MKYRTIRTAIGGFGDEDPESQLGIDRNYRAPNKTTIYVHGIDKVSEYVVGDGVMRLVGPKTAPKIGYTDRVVDDPSVEGRVIGCIYTRSNGTIVVRAAYFSENGVMLPIRMRSRDIGECRIKDGQYVELGEAPTLMEFGGVQALIVGEKSDGTVAEEDEIGLECMCLSHGATYPKFIRDAIRWGRANKSHPARALILRRHATPRQLIEAFEVGKSLLPRRIRRSLRIRAAIIIGFLLGAGATCGKALLKAVKIFAD